MWSLGLKVVVDVTVLRLRIFASAFVHVKFGWFLDIARIAGTCTCLQEGDLDCEQMRASRSSILCTIYIFDSTKIVGHVHVICPGCGA